MSSRGKSPTGWERQVLGTAPCTCDWCGRRSSCCGLSLHDGHAVWKGADGSIRMQRCVELMGMMVVAWKRMLRQAIARTDGGGGTGKVPCRAARHAAIWKST